MNRYVTLMILATLLFAKTKGQGGPPNAGEELYPTVEDASEIHPGENIDEKIRKNFFLRAEVSKQDCYVGEAIMATFKAYSRLDANSQVLKRPSLSGFSVIEMVDAYNNHPDIEEYNAEYYYVHLIRKVQLFPLQPGDFILEPAEVESVIHLRQNKGDGGRMRSLRNLFRKNPELQRQIIFKTPEVKVHVTQLPEEGQPHNFSGAVGTFNIKLRTDDANATQHEPSTVSLLIEGAGNFPLITDPVIKWPVGVDVSPPIVTEDVNKYEFPLSGRKLFEYTLNNNDTGSFVLPPVEFSYFDPYVREYRTVRSDTVAYTVKAGDHKRRFSPKEIVGRSKETPLHFYYFGIVGIVIVGVIVFILVKKPK